jgi:predicted hydrocarbon binding protein
MTVSEQLDFKHYYVERLYMSANVETGVLTNRSGRRMLALTNDFLLGLHRALAKECGERVSGVLYRCGRKWGRNFGKGLTDAWSEFYGTSFKEFPLAFFQSLLIQEFACNGWGVLTIDYTQVNRGVLEMQLDGAIMSEITEETVDYPLDNLTAGILAGMCSIFMDRVQSLLAQTSLNTHREKLEFLLNTKN